ncbi:hypothetical protein C8Q80DRAFT_472435 [Daedaleopsis nitida]|nr:hypothetical protein C8Q80DRAFT_472435 [Daedaleopsis nitida]
MASRLRVKTIPGLLKRTIPRSLGYRLSRLASNTAVPIASHIRLPRSEYFCLKPDHRSARSYTTPSSGGDAAESFPDPDRPDLFYHLYTPPTALSSTTPVFALSFLATPPPSLLSSSVVGWLPASGEGEGAGLNDFVENERFREVLHEAIQSALHDGADEVQRNGAIQTGEGWMHIHDNRNVPALGRIGDPDDIIASVRVENGEILADTYQPMPSYRLCTSDGVLQLTEGLAARLIEVLETRVREEQT